jgi:hypothetical protein
MSIYHITPEQFDKLNKSLSVALDMDYNYIEHNGQQFECSNKLIPWNKNRPWSKQEKKNISNGRKGQPSIFKGKKRPELSSPHTKKSKLKMSVVCKNRPKTSCILCRKIISGQSNFMQHYKFNH